MAVLEMSSLTRDEQKARVEELLREFGLEKIRKSLGIQLSGGVAEDEQVRKVYLGTELRASLTARMSIAPVPLTFSRKKNKFAAAKADVAELVDALDLGSSSFGSGGSSPFIRTKQ